MFSWLDRNLWGSPFGVFVLFEAAIGGWSHLPDRPLLLAAAPITTRQQIYSSLAGSSTALLGFTIAAVAILVAFGLRPSGLWVGALVINARCPHLDRPGRDIAGQGHS